MNNDRLSNIAKTARRLQTITDLETITLINEQLGRPLLCTPSMVATYAELAITGAVRGDVVQEEQPMLAGLYGEEEYPSALQSSRIDNIGIINVSGALIDRHMNTMCGTISSYEGLLSSCQDMTDDPTITDIVVRFNTSGGVTTNCFATARSIKALSDADNGTTFHAIADGRAMSAGFALMSAFPNRWMVDGGAIGNVGVYYRFANNEKRLKKEGIAVEYFYAGEFKITGAPELSLTDNQRKYLKEMTDSDYRGFVALVSENTGMSPSEVESTGAKWYTGSDAVDVGFATHIGTFKELLMKINQQDDTMKNGKNGTNGAIGTDDADATTSNTTGTTGTTGTNANAGDTGGTNANATGTNANAGNTGDAKLGELITNLTGLMETQGKTIEELSAKISSMQADMDSLEDNSSVNGSMSGKGGADENNAKSVWGAVLGANSK